MEQSSVISKKLWRIVRVVYYMIRKGFSKDKLTVELNLLLKRGKIAGKALGNFLTFNHHHHYAASAASGGGSARSSFSCRYMDPNLSVYNPRGFEFSCSNTPNYPAARHGGGIGGLRRQDLDAAMIAKAFEILNSEALSGASSVVASPSPAPFWNFGKSPAVAVRQLRITDSPFPVRGEEEEAAEDGKVDVMAEEFIRRFYEDLQLQKRIPETPENQHFRRKRMTGRA